MFRQPCPREPDPRARAGRGLRTPQCGQPGHWLGPERVVSCRLCRQGVRRETHHIDRALRLVSGHELFTLLAVVY